MTTTWRIPPSLLKNLQQVPRDRPILLLLRHSVRDELPPGKAGTSLPITETGKQLASQLGTMLGSRLQSLHSSPLVRCIQTAEALSTGAGIALSVIPDHHLGAPGIFVLDGQLAQPHWQKLGHESVTQQLTNGSNMALDGMARPNEAARFLVLHMLHAAGIKPGIHVFVSHDSLITATVARITGKQLQRKDWPEYLQGALLWQQADHLSVLYGGYETRNVALPLCGLVNTDVIEFARREIAASVGLHCGARFFLAGGAFKTLLTGRPPRDLDLWAPSQEDRRLLVRALDLRGAQPQAARPFADAYLINGRLVEVPHSTEPTVLEERLGESDISLSAVGLEHSADGSMRAVIHPLALESVRRREVLLLKPLFNRGYALITLERMQRYAIELGYSIPPTEEAEVWRALSTIDLVKTLERYRRAGGGSEATIAQARTRLTK